MEATAPLTDPLGELARLTAEAIGFKDAIAARVNALTEVRYSATGAGTEQIRGEVQLLERAMDRAAKFADLLARHDWIGKKLELETGQANIVIQAVGDAMDAVAHVLTGADRDTFLDVFLRGIGQGGLAGVVTEHGSSEAPVVVRGELA